MEPILSHFNSFLPDHYPSVEDWTEYIHYPLQTAVGITRSMVVSVGDLIRIEAPAVWFFEMAKRYYHTPNATYPTEWVRTWTRRRWERPTDEGDNYLYRHPGGCTIYADEDMDYLVFEEDLPGLLALMRIMVREGRYDEPGTSWVRT